jgi:hypothetical protein
MYVVRLYIGVSVHIRTSSHQSRWPRCSIAAPLLEVDFRVRSCSCSAPPSPVCSSASAGAWPTRVSETVGAALAACRRTPRAYVSRHARGAKDAVEDHRPSAKLYSEHLGAYILVLAVGLHVIGGSPAEDSSIASPLMCMLYALSSCSDAYVTGLTIYFA